MKAIDELKYSPNLHARSLAGGKSQSIGMIVSNLENPFFLDIYKAVEAGVQAAGFELILASTDYHPERLVAGLRLMLGRRVAGIAAIVPEADWNLVRELENSQIPIIFCGASVSGRNAASIRVNYRHGMDKLISYLYSLGHRRLGFAGHQTLAKSADERMTSLRKASARWPDLRVETAGGADSLEGGCQAARALLGVDPKLTAIVCANDLMAVGALRELREHGIRVPHEVSVAGCDNIQWGQYSHPALTTIHIPRDRIGQSICDCLLNPEKSRHGHEIVIDAELVLRDSTGPANTELSDRGWR